MAYPRLRRVVLGSVGLALLGALGAIWTVAQLRAPRIQVPDRGSFVLPAVTLIEPGVGSRSDMDLRVEAGRIASIEPAEGVSTEISAEFARGLYVLPGLVDLHVHYPPRAAVGNGALWSLLFLAHGVTTVREAGSIDGASFSVRERIHAGRVPGPRIFTCGAMLDGDPPSFPTNRVVESAEQARRAVADQVARGADCIKVYNRLSAEVLAVIVDEAERAGLPVVGHKPHAADLGQMAGSDIQHLTGAPQVDLELIGLEDYRPKDWDSVDEERIAWFVETSRRLGIAHTPALVNPRQRRHLHEPARAAAPTASRYLPELWVQVWPAIWGAPEAGDRYESMRTKMKSLTVRLHRAGVAIRAGSDTLMPFVVPGAGLIGELEELVDAGLTPAEALSVATREAARALQLEGLGSLQIGAPADLIVVREDPTLDLQAIASLEAVVADGRLYSRTELEGALGRFEEHFRGAFYSAVMGQVVRVILGRFKPGEIS